MPIPSDCVIRLPDYLSFILIFPLETVEAWPESEEAAYATVNEARAEKAAAGGSVPSETDTWTRHEYIIATQARIPIIKGIS